MRLFRLFIYVILIMTISLSGCTTEKKANTDPPQNTTDPAYTANLQLQTLLPPKEGFVWLYHGFAEYGHLMTLNSIEKKENIHTYNIDGEVFDPSGGEAKNRDFSLKLSYVIENEQLTQIKKETAMMDSQYDQLILIKTPLIKGTNWTQSVVSKDNKSTTLNCSIEDIQNVNGVNIYTVIYNDKNSKYYEKRQLKDGVGTISFEKLYITEEEDFPITYHLYEEASGYK